MSNSNQADLNDNLSNGRWKLVALWMTPIGLMILAAVVYGLVQKGYLSIGSINKGQLIQPPIQLNDWVFKDNEGSDFNWDKWSLVVRGSNHCDQQCLDNLVLSRQVHIRLDKKANELQRVYWLDATSTSEPENAKLIETLKQEHPFLKFVSSYGESIAAIDKVLAAQEGSVRYFLVDPDGWAMMSYSEQHDAADLHKDIKYLLKYAN